MDENLFPLITLAHGFGPKAKLILGPYLCTDIEGETAALGGFFFPPRIFLSPPFFSLMMMKVSEPNNHSQVQSLIIS